MTWSWFLLLFVVGLLPLLLSPASQLDRHHLAQDEPFCISVPDLCNIHKTQYNL